MRNKRYLLFTAGPVNVSSRVKKAMVYSEIGHREVEFSVILRDIRQKLLTLFGANSRDFCIVIISGSGTAAVESVLTSSVHDKKKILVVSNGYFGERMAEICQLHGLGLNHICYEWGQYPDVKEIEDILRKDTNIEVVAMVFMETSTGMINPVKEVGRLCRKYNKIFVVDAISGLGGDYLNVVNDNIDFCISNTNKCLSGLPVLSFVCAKRSAVARIRDIKPRVFYLDFLKHFDYEENLCQTPYTPQIPLFLMLGEAVDEIIKEGVENRIKRYQSNSLLLREKLEKMGFKFQLEKNVMSNVMTNVLIPMNITFGEIHDELKKKGYIIYPGKRHLEGKIMHIANVGTLKKADVLRFCSALKSVFNKREVKY
ncbi:MAG: alanine--glyoxylate aminotransferase family protein [Candidatus Jordarchaeaceae archaeon]